MSDPRVALLVIGDGRDDLRTAMLESFTENARNLDVRHTATVDDRRHELGFCGAIQEGWEQLREVSTEFDYVIHLEEDWLFNRAFDVRAMTDLLTLHPQFAQVALRRGREPGEDAAPVEAWPDHFEDHRLITPEGSWPYLAHSDFFTTNPSVYTRDLTTDYDWPEPPRCEAEFTRRLVAHDRRFAYWGARGDAPWITHTGLTRTGVRY